MNFRIDQTPNHDTQISHRAHSELQQKGEKSRENAQSKMVENGEKQQVIQELRQRDREVRSHEQAHQLRIVR